MCCTGSSCNAGLTCQSSTCRAPAACGASTQTCCTGNMCNAGLTCTSGTCMTAACGASAQQCCSGGMCHTGLTCTNGTCMMGTSCGGTGSTCARQTDCCGMLACQATSGSMMCCATPGNSCTQDLDCCGVGHVRSDEQHLYGRNRLRQRWCDVHRHNRLLHGAYVCRRAVHIERVHSRHGVHGLVNLLRVACLQPGGRGDLHELLCRRCAVVPEPDRLLRPDALHWRDLCVPE